MRKFPKWIWILGLVILIGFTPVLPIAFSHPHGKGKAKAKAKGKAKEINVLLEYIDNAHFSIDTPIEGVAYTIYDGLNQVIVSGITDVNGMISFIVFEAYNQDGNGIHIEYRNSIRIFIKIMWQGTLVSINNLIVGGELHIEELLAFMLSPTFLWEDLTTLPVGTVVDFYFEGMYFDSATINSIGQLDIVNVLAGTYMLNSTFFSGIEMVVLIDQPARQLAETFIISAQFKRISRFGNKTGSFIFYFLIEKSGLNV